MNDVNSVDVLYFAWNNYIILDLYTSDLDV